MRVLVMTIGLGLAACYVSNPPPQYAVQNSTPPPSGPSPLSGHSVWTGQYRCAQGQTAVELTLDIDANGAVAGVFSFGPLGVTSTIPDGAYRLRGSVTPGAEADGLAISLEPDGWISQPDDYVMVPVRGIIDRERRSMEGQMENASCGAIKVMRSD
jgi:hypothetical protein